MQNVATGLVEKVTMDLARAITALVKKVVCALEKAAVDGRRGGNGGRQAAITGWRCDGDGGRRVATLGAVEMSATGHSDVVENAEAALQNGSVGVLERIGLLPSWTVELESRPVNGSVWTIRRPHHNIYIYIIYLHY
jgi:hypothetical protein